MSSDSRRSRVISVLSDADVPRDILTSLIEQGSEDWVLELCELKDSIPVGAWRQWLVAAAQHGANYPFYVRQQQRSSPYPSSSSPLLLSREPPQTRGSPSPAPPTGGRPIPSPMIRVGPMTGSSSSRQPQSPPQGGHYAPIYTEFRATGIR